MKKQTVLVQFLALCIASALAATAESEITLKNVSLGAELRERWEGRRDPDLDRDADDGGSFVLQRLRFHAAFKAPEQNLEIFAQFQDSRAWGQEPSTASNEDNVDLHQGYVRFERLFNQELTVWVGRQELNYGEQRLVGAFGWSNIGRSFDAARARYEWDKAALEGFAAKINERTPPVGEGRKDADDVDFYGLYAFLDFVPAHAWHLYAFFLRDGLDVAGEIPARGLANASDFATLGTRIEGKLFEERFQWSAEAAYQTGDRATDPHSAYAAYARAAWTLHRATKTSVLVEGDVASGDGDAADGRSREFHNLFPTNHLRYGYIDFMGWRNTRSYSAGVKTSPKKWGTFALNVWALGLEEARGAWKSAGGAVLGVDPTGTSGQSVGTEADLTWKRSFREGKVGFLAGYSIFRPGRFAKATRGDDDAHFGYVQMAVKL
jgi:hypothetical protein